MTEKSNFKGRVLNLVGDAMPVPKHLRLVPEAYTEAGTVECNSRSFGRIIAFEDNRAWTRHQDLGAFDVPTMSVSFFRNEVNIILVPPATEPLTTFVRRNAERPDLAAPVLKQCGAILAKLADVQIMPDELRPPSFKDEGLLPYALLGQFAVTHRATGEPRLTAGLPFVFPDRTTTDVKYRVAAELSVSGAFLPPVNGAGEMGLPIGSDLRDALRSFESGFYA